MTSTIKQNSLILRTSTIDQNPSISKKQISIAYNLDENLNDFFFIKNEYLTCKQKKSQFSQKILLSSKNLILFLNHQLIYKSIQSLNSKFFQKIRQLWQNRGKYHSSIKKLKNSLQRFEKSLKFKDHPKSSNDAFDEDEFKKVSDEIKL